MSHVFSFHFELNKKKNQTKPIKTYEKCYIIYSREFMSTFFSSFHFFYFLLVGAAFLLPNLVHTSRK